MKRSIIKKYHLTSAKTHESGRARADLVVEGANAFDEAKSASSAKTRTLFIFIDFMKK